AEGEGAANVGWAASDASSGIVCRHGVQPGAASGSYGIRRAQRAGIPGAVIRHASRELSRLEAQGAPPPQLDLFAAAAPSNNHADPAMHQDDAESSLRSALEAIDPDQLTPREALDMLYRLRNEHL